MKNEPPPTASPQRGDDLENGAEQQQDAEDQYRRERGDERRSDGGRPENHQGDAHTDEKPRNLP